MANVGKKVVKYNLELTESEYCAILTVLGGLSYVEYRDLVNRRYSIRLGRTTTEEHDILTQEEYSILYNQLEDHKW